MSHLLAIIGSEEVQHTHFARLQSRLEALTLSQVDKVINTPSASFAISPNQQGTGYEVAADPSTGAHLVILGVCVQQGNYSNGPLAPAILKDCLSGSLALVAKSLEGAFILVFVDPRNSSISFVTDIAGSAHVFYRQLQNGFAISTSARVLASAGSPRLDAVAVQEFWASGIVYEKRSLWQDVHKIGPASILSFRDNRKDHEQRYWSFSELNPKTYNLASGSKALSDSLDNALKRLSVRYPDLLADVTGGYDSRALIGSLLHQQLPFSATVSGAAGSPDVEVARKISEKFNLPFYHVDSHERYDPQSILEALALTDGEYEVVEYARIANTHKGHASRGHSISLNGSYGELARGYWWELLFPKLGNSTEFDAGQLANKRFAALAYDVAAIDPTIRIDFRDHMQQVITRSINPYRALPNITQMDHAYFDLRMQRWQGRIGSSTSHIWPCVSPFMFRSVLTPILETSALARWRSLLVRRTLSDTVPKLASMPLEHGYPAEPATLLNFYKFGPVVSHYGDRILSKVFKPQYQAPTRNTEGQALMAALDLEKPSDWQIGHQGLFLPEQIQKYQLLNNGALSLPAKRLLTLELALRSVSNAA